MWFLLGDREVSLTTQFGDILSIFAEIVHLRLTVDKGFYSAI